MIKLSTIAPMILLLSIGACQQLPRPRPDGTAQATGSEQEKPDKVLQPFKSVQGTPYLVANITQQVWEKSRSISSESYSRGKGGIHNLVFLNSASLVSHRLFDTNQNLILEAKPYPLASQGPQPKAKKKRKTARFVYQVVKKDTNENKDLDAGDQRTIGISDAFGKQYVEVLTDITQLLNLQKLSGDRLLAVYIKNGTKTASVIDLDQRKVVKTNAIATLDPDVK